MYDIYAYLSLRAMTSAMPLLVSEDFQASISTGCRAANDLTSQTSGEATDRWECVNATAKECFTLSSCHVLLRSRGSPLIFLSIITTSLGIMVRYGLDTGNHSHPSNPPVVLRLHLPPAQEGCARNQTQMDFRVRPEISS